MYIFVTYGLKLLLNVSLMESRSPTEQGCRPSAWMAMANKIGTDKL
ncbi:MAG: hypothetical protein F6K64_16110 [Moorea sp. SIO3A2]|nr:hypothetical protein [Moorena sp. SIO3A2]